MSNVRRQAQTAYDLQAYVDQLAGGTGRGWFRIVTDPSQARAVIEAGTLTTVFPVSLVMPVYPTGPHGNSRGLTDLGAYAMAGMMRRGMMLEIDHMSVKAADRALDLLEKANYPGVLSTHSWGDELYLDRVFRLGGLVTQYGHDATAFVPEWQRTKPLLTTYDRGYGFGMDMNGFGGTPAPPATARVTLSVHNFRRRVHRYPADHRCPHVGLHHRRRRPLRAGAGLGRGPAHRRRSRPCGRPRPGRRELSRQLGRDPCAHHPGQPRGRPCRDRQLDAMVALRQLRARQRPARGRGRLGGRARGATASGGASISAPRGRWAVSPSTGKRHTQRPIASRRRSTDRRGAQRLP